MKIRIRNLVVNRVIGGRESEQQFVDEYAELGWTLASAILITTSGANSYATFYFTKTIIEE